MLQTQAPETAENNLQDSTKAHKHGIYKNHTYDTTYK
jgi:hypothetical protein